MRSLYWLSVAGVTACGTGVVSGEPEPPAALQTVAHPDPCGLDLTGADNATPIRVAVSGTRISARIQMLESSGLPGGPSRPSAATSGTRKGRW